MGALRRAERRRDRRVDRDPIEPTNQTNESTWQFWVPIPHDGGPYEAIVELIEKKENHLLKLATLRTEELRAIPG